MTIRAKYRGVCGRCSTAINPGDSIEWSRGAKPVHSTCNPTVFENQAVTVYPCWTCSEPGKLRNHGASTPVLCDAHEAAYRSRFDCPTCKRANVLTVYEAKNRYQCASCTARDEGVGFGA